MIPDADTFGALARSSPWRWSRLHLRHRSPSGHVEAWVWRPDRMRVRVAGRPDAWSGHPYTSVSSGAPVAIRWPSEVVPQLRDDGLVARRPGYRDEAGRRDPLVAHGDPMHADYR